VTKAAIRNGAARKNAKNHLIGDDGFPGSGFVDHLLCNHINVMGELIDSKDLVAVNSVYIKQDQLHGDSDFVCIDTEWSEASWGHGPDGYITEFGAADAEDTVLVTGLQPIPSAGQEKTKKKRELRIAMQWVIDRCPDGRPLHQYISGGGYLDGSYLGADMKGVVLTARAYGVDARIIANFANLGGANAYHLVASCFKDEGPGLKRLGSLWQGMCQPNLPPQTSAWPRPHRPDDDAVMLHCFLVKFYPAFGLCNSSWFHREP